MKEESIEDRMSTYTPKGEPCTREEALTSEYVKTFDDGIDLIREKIITAIMEGKDDRCAIIIAGSLPTTNDDENPNAQFMALKIMGEAMATYNVAQIVTREIVNKHPRLKALIHLKEKLKGLSSMLGMPSDGMDRVLEGIMGGGSMPDFDEFMKDMENMRMRRKPGSDEVGSFPNLDGRNLDQEANAPEPLIKEPNSPIMGSPIRNGSNIS